MHTLKIAFVDFWPEWPDEDFISPILNKHFNVVVDSRKPDVLFHSRGFYQQPVADRYSCKKILFLGENHRPSQFTTDYSISFDPPTDTNFRLPLWQAFLLKFPNMKERLFGERKRFKEEEFERFCSFTVSNSSNMLRNNHYDIMKTYKKVHSYGRVRTNTLELQRLSQNMYWRTAKDLFFLNHPHKFMMTYENTSYPWYCTEKLMDAFLVGSLPIYWGDPKVGEDWNQRAFINVQKNDNWFDFVKTADTNQTFWEEFYEEPVFTDDQKKKHQENLKNFETWLIDVIKM